MKLIVTGAAGFLGRYVVAEALRRGHEVRALVRARSATDSLPRDDERLELARCDLRAPHDLAGALAGADAVLHLAAAKAGDIYAQLASTVVATEHLLKAMDETGVRHIVHVSSFALYEYLGKRSWSVLDESSPLERHPEQRDEYCQTKLIQEQLVVDHAKAHEWRWTVLRPGVIYGRGHTWTARLGVQVGDRRWVRTGAWAPLPLNYVENCAEAIVLAAERDEANGRILNVIDDETPTQRRYVRLLRQRSRPPPSVFPVSWTIMRALARLAWLTNRVCFGGRAKVPGVLVPCKLHARIKPLRYDNRAIREALGWSPRYGVEEALDRSFAPPAPARVETPERSGAPVGVER